MQSLLGIEECVTPRKYASVNEHGDAVAEVKRIKGVYPIPAAVSR
jgi:hypothetical protein